LWFVGHSEARYELAMKLATPLEFPVDGRQSETALAIARGTTRLLHAHGRCVVSELPLPSGRRADLVGLDSSGELWIVEIKSSIADFRADQKMAGLPCPLRPAFLRHHGRGAVRDLPARNRVDCGRCVWRGIQMRGAGAQIAGRDTQIDDAAIRACRRDAVAVAGRSDRTLWRCRLKLQ
jgi:hypothetical protein